MNSVKFLTIFLICMLIILSFITSYFIYVNRFIIKESFFASKHNCYPYTYDLNAGNSYKTLSKGWCTTGDYDDIDSEDNYESHGESSMKCPDRHYRVNPDESIKYKSKAWCRKA